MLRGFGAEMQVVTDPSGPSDMGTTQLAPLHSLRLPDVPTSAAEMAELGVVHLSSAAAARRRHVDTNRWQFRFLSVPTCSENPCAGPSWRSGL